MAIMHNEKEPHGIYFLRENSERDCERREYRERRQEYHDSLLCLRDDKRNETERLASLNEVIVMAEDDIATKEAHVEVLEAVISSG
ncbi:hypothetical protein Tco_0382561 [Tanacetum coccineum]